MINTVAQGVLGRNQSLSVDKVLRSPGISGLLIGKTWTYG